jgi:acetyl-CoA carboxylase carboxyl transferase alpha subunit/acetyl-CoA carboxylase carboxyl transferase beta subunit
VHLKGLFKKENQPVRHQNQAEAPNVPDGLYTKCESCHEMILTEDFTQNAYVCPKCGHYMKIGAYERIKMVFDAQTFEEWDEEFTGGNPCHFKGYEEKLGDLQRNTGLNEAVITGKGKIDGMEAAVGVCDTRFLMGSMGYAVGEKLTRAIERATVEKLPLIIFTCSGGARMQEGIVSLMQMEKTAAALKKFDAAGLYITVLTNPTTGGVTASFAMLGDIILAEPQALVGFAGPRVIRQTIGEELPEGFQRAEFLLEHGLIDNIVERRFLKQTLSTLLRLHKKPQAETMSRYQQYLDDIYAKKIDIKKEETLLAAKNEKKQLSAWEKVQIARSGKRPSALDYIGYLTKDFYELHGDRAYRDDGAVVGGIAFFGKQPVTVIGQQKGATTKENIVRNFGMPYPEGYRKALRLMKQAEKFHRPVLCLVDTPGAYCGIGAEERGQGEAIAKNLFEMADLKVPVLSIVIGEGGSGGALALAAGNEVWMLENSVYSILSPEGFASILWKDASKAEKAAQVMKLTAQDLKELGIIEQILPEFPVVSSDNMNRVTLYMKRKIAGFLVKYQQMGGEELAEQRYQRFRGM